MFFIAILAIAVNAIAQESFSLPLMLKNDDGSLSSYDIKKGDTLVYEVNAGSNTYDFIVIINDESSEEGIDFNYEMTNAANTRGHVTINADAKKKATKYVNYFRGGELKLTDACTVWLSGKNFDDMTNKKTTLQLDNNAPETFYLPDDNEVYPVVKIKGEDKKINGFAINNAADGNGTKTLWINDISANPLIIKMDLGFSIALKEIR